jgi:hypothetical protein
MEDRDLMAAMGSMTILDRFALLMWCLEAEVRVFAVFLCLSAIPLLGRLLDPLLLLERDY